MYRYRCNKCNGRCDPGDLVGGICDECREQLKEDNRKSNQLEKKWDRLVIKTKGQLSFAIGGYTDGCRN